MVTDFPFLGKEREVCGPLLELLPPRSDPDKHFEEEDEVTTHPFINHVNVFFPSPL